MGLLSDHGSGPIVEDGSEEGIECLDFGPSRDVSVLPEMAPQFLTYICCDASSSVNLYSFFIIIFAIPYTL